MPTLVLALVSSSWMMSSVPQVPASYWSVLADQSCPTIVSILLMLVWVVKVSSVIASQFIVYAKWYVICLSTAPCTAAQLRLAGGNIANEGRVEICIDNIWGTVCINSWGRTDAAVVCRQLGYSSQGPYQLIHVWTFCRQLSV